MLSENMIALSKHRLAIAKNLNTANKEKMMNQKAIINGKEYRFIKTETDMITNRTAVLFENEHGCSFICPVEAWLENAKREEPAFNKYASPEKKIALFKSLFIGRKTGKMMSPLSEPCADNSIYR